MTDIPTISREEGEIRQIEDDLRNLRRRYAILDRSARRTKIAFYVLIALLLAIILAAAAIGNPGAQLLFTAVLVVTIITAWATAHTHPELRWIDIAGSWPEGYVKRSEAQAIEDMVAERMERLARLKGNLT